MFYDEATRRMLESSPFTEAATLLVESGGGSAQFTLKGIFCSGNYGQKDLDKGYTTRKTVARQSFQIAGSSIPCTLEARDLIRQTLCVRGVEYKVREVTGNDSGVIVLDLVK